MNASPWRWFNNHYQLCVWQTDSRLLPGFLCCHAGLLLWPGDNSKPLAPTIKQLQGVVKPFPIKDLEEDARKYQEEKDEEEDEEEDEEGSEEEEDQEEGSEEDKDQEEGSEEEDQEEQVRGPSCWVVLARLGDRKQACGCK